jgi:hypothetical protein
MQGKASKKGFMEIQNRLKTIEDKLDSIKEWW